MPSAKVSTSVRIGLGGQVTQRLDAYLKGVATQVVNREGYQSVNALLSRRIKVAAQYAKNATERKYPMARERDERRRPIPGAPHLADSWDYQLASGRGGAKLINKHPKANMLIFGIEKDSVITPNNYTDRNGDPVLIFPRAPNPSHIFVEGSKNLAILKTSVTRPVPRSQRRVDVNESIPYRAIRNALRSARRG